MGFSAAPAQALVSTAFELLSLSNSTTWLAPNGLSVDFHVWKIDMGVPFYSMSGALLTNRLIYKDIYRIGAGVVERQVAPGLPLDNL